MKADFETRLKGGHPNSLGNTIEVVEEVLANQSLFKELFQCYFSPDEVVRLRVSNAMKRLCKAQKELLIPYVDRLLEEISNIPQASTQWTLAQLFLELETNLNPEQLKKAKEILTHNLAHHDDWIVLNTTMETLAQWSAKDQKLKQWLLPQLERLSADQRKSVAGRAKKLIVKWY